MFFGAWDRRGQCAEPVARRVVYKRVRLGVGGGEEEATGVAKHRDNHGTGGQLGCGSREKRQDEENIDGL